MRKDRELANVYFDCYLFWKSIGFPILRNKKTKSLETIFFYFKLGVNKSKVVKSELDGSFLH